tara:strand:+ start:1417 stop:2058 length:642 start_codon:yes stop_codon:yes gene_type:complete
MRRLLALSNAARALLPAGAAVASGDPRAPAPPLWPGENLRASPARRAEFAAGRAAARAAMIALGHPAAAIPMQPDRAPLWPPGLVGSITHSATACLAAVLPIPALIGIDLEPATALETNLWSTILRPEEQAWLQGRADAGLLAKQIFSAKEATYKAQYPVSKTIFGFEAIRISLTATDFTATFTTSISGFHKGSTLHGRHCLTENHILTVVAP